jgi:predicted nucleotidyltransferase
MTENSSAATSLLNKVVASSQVPVGTELYLFGSVSDGTPGPNDVDVLLVYPDGRLDQAHALAESIRNIPAQDFDVLALSATEEHELAFVRSERAVRIWPSMR